MRPTLGPILAPTLAGVALAAGLVLAGCPRPGESAPPSGPGTPTTPQGAPPPPPPPRPFDRAALRTPWRLCRVGDWASYRLVQGNRTLRFEVTEVAERTVSFVQQDPQTRAAQGRPTVVNLEEEERRYKDPMTYDGLALDAQGNPIRPSRQQAEVAGRPIEVLVVRRAMPGMGSTELWLAEETVRPFMQCAVRSIRDGNLQFELVDWGEGPR